MARVLKVFSALLMCVGFSQCGYIPFPDEPLRPIQVIQGGPTCHRCQPLQYQVQVPVTPPAAPCGQQYGVKVEVPLSAPCNPYLNVGYDIEMPMTPCAPKLPNLPVSVTVPTPHYDCHQPCHMNYELETPVAPCTPLLTNLKTQVDRVVLPCPCTPPIHDGYVPEPEPPRRRKRFVDWQDCDDDDGDDGDDFLDDNSSSRNRRSPANWRPSSASSSRSELFPSSRREQSPRSDWMMDEDDSEPFTQSRRPMSTRSQKRIVSRGFGDASNDYVFGGSFEGSDEDDGRIVSPDSDDDGRIMSRGFGGPNDDGRIVSPGFGHQYDDGRIVSPGFGHQNDDGSIVSRGSVDGYDSLWRPQVSSEPVERRKQDPHFITRHDPQYISLEDRILIDSLLSTGTGGSEQSGVVNAQLGTSGGSAGGTVIDNILGSVRSDDHLCGRFRPCWKGGRQQNGGAQQNNEQAPLNRTRLNGSSGPNRRSSGQGGSQNRVTTPNTNRTGGRQGSLGSSGSASQIDTQGQGSQQEMNGTRRMGGSNTTNGSQRPSANQRTANSPQSQQRGGGSQRQSGSQQTRGGSQTQSSSQQGRVASQSQGGSQKRSGVSRKQGGSQQRQVDRLSYQRQQGPERVGDSQRETEEEPQWIGGSQRQNGREDWTGSAGSQQSRGQPNQRQRGPSSNSETRRRPGQRTSGQSRSTEFHNGEMSTPGDYIRRADYLDNPEQLGVSAMNGLPPVGTSSSQRIMNHVAHSHHLSSQIHPSVLNAIDYPPHIQTQSALDATRIVTPTTYDQQPPLSDYDFDYYS